jgi:hypothetical protein
LARWEAIAINQISVVWLARRSSNLYFALGSQWPLAGNSEIELARRRLSADYQWETARTPRFASPSPLVVECWSTPMAAAVWKH